MEINKDPDEVIFKQSVIKKIFLFEKQRTYLTVIRYILFVIIFLIGIIISAAIILNIFFEKDTFAVLDIFSENIEIIRQYFLNILFIIYIEAPKYWILLLFILLLLLIFTLFKIKKNYKKLKNRLLSIKQFFSNKS